jgi:PAS domain S-box-containing protein
MRPGSERESITKIDPEVILDSITDAFFFVDRNWRFAYANRQANLVLGREPGDLLGRILWEEYPGLAGSEFERVYHRVAGNRVPESFTSYYPDHDRWYEVHVYPTADGLSVYFRDVSERMRSAERLAAREARYQTLFNSIDEGFCIIEMLFDQDGKPFDYRFLEVNRVFEQQTGLRQAVGKTVKALAPAHEQHWFDIYGKVALTGEPVRFENEAKALQRWFDVNAFRIDHPDERRVAILFKDITARKQSENELRQADRRKDEFLAMLAHELRNPLAPIGTAAELLKIGHLDRRQVAETSAVIARQVDHMTHLVDDLLDVSRVTRGLVTLDRAVLDLKVIVDNAVEQVRPLLEARHHRLTVQLAAEPAYVLGDRVRLVQIIANLLNNAAKYTPPHGAITLTIDVMQDEVALSVRDNGIGIAPELLPVVFELFAQGERSMDRAQGGLGLGLALVKSIVGLHGGSVTVESAGPGAGSLFSIRLPRQAVGEQAQQPSDDAAVPYGHGARVMVVDDNLDALRTLANLLAAYGYEVNTARDADAALEAAAANPAQIFILDIGLPDTDGYVLARRLRELPQTAHAALIALSGYGRDEERERMAGARFDHHLMKPVNTEKLLVLLGDAGAHRHVLH